MSREPFALSFTSLDLVSEQALPADPSDLVQESSLGTIINSGYSQFAGNLDGDPSFALRYGGYWPADRVQNPNHAPSGFFSESQLWASLSWSRWLDERNMLARGFAKHVNAFVGAMQVQFVRRGRNPGNQDADGNGQADDPLVAACQEVWEEWCESADWGQGTEDREEEARNRILRDGECNLRLDCGDRRRDYLPWVRFVEPEQIRRPSVNVRTEGNWDWGVCTDGDDAEDPLAYFLADPNSNGAHGEEVPGSAIVRMKANVDRTIKRGVSDLFPIEAHLQRAIAIMANMEATSQEQSGISWVEKYATATADQVVNQLKLGQAVYQANSPAVSQARFAPFAPKPFGATRVIHSDNNKDWIPGPVSEGVPSYSQVLDGTLKGIGFTWGVPGWFSGQGESSFAAALVTGSPFVRLTGMRQKKQSGFTKKLAQRVIELAEKSGRLPAGTSRRVKPTVTCEPVVIADEQKQATVTDMELRNKLIDPQEAIKKRGRDPKVVIANIKAWEKEFAPTGPAAPPQLPAQAPGKDPEPAPPGSAGGDGSEGVDQLFEKVEEGSGPHSFASVHTPLTGPAAFELLSLARSVRPEDLDEKGCETEPHVTVLYGLHSDDPAGVLPILRVAKPIAMRLGRVSVFPGHDRDVLKVDVESDDLQRLNTALAGLPHTNDFPDYQPHATIAYVRPGLGAVYAARMRPVDLDVVCDRLIFSDRANQQIVVPLRTGVAEDGGLIEKEIQVHRDGKTFTQKRKVRAGDDGAKSPSPKTVHTDGAPDKAKREQADAEQAKGIVDDVAAAFPDVAKKPGVLAKVQNFAGKISQKVNDFILAHATTFTRLGSALNIAEALLTTPEDVQKSPWLASKWAGGKTAGDHIADWTSDALGVGYGVPGMVAVKLVSLAMTKAFVTMKRFAGSKVAEGDSVDEVATVVAGLMDTVFEAMGLPTGADTDEIASALRGQVSESAPSGKVWKEITFQRGGKSITQKRLVNAPKAEANKETKAKSEPKPVPAKAAKADPKEVVAGVKAMLADPSKITHEMLPEVASKLKSLTVEQIKQLQEEHKAKGGANKAARMEKLLTAVRAKIAAKAATASPHSRIRDAMAELGIAHEHLSDEDLAGHLGKLAPPKKDPEPHPKAVEPAKPSPKATTAAKSAKPPAIPAGHTKAADLGEGAIVTKDKAGELTTRFPDGEPERQAGLLSAKIADAMDDLRLDPDFEDGLITLGRIVSDVRRANPGVSETDVLAALSHMRDTRQVEAQALNEVQKLTNGSKGITPLGGGKDTATSTLWNNGRALHFWIMRKKGASQ